ncbi:Probable diguanylate cyclase YcdT [Ralstonia pickettii]|uniref:GGDEF domain-containing protein n=1 Tax=Ralstonia TaxID=48736 RepID=UPI0001E69F9F|nr:MULTISPECIES: GGDEF domain-containing protein [Ralstonia]EFP67553.1 diguanylate cyclase (GGDEF) domain protein [Ralstonia pickettii]EGY65726.1 diguanylate cyclase (GGDEF) domain-containing protein [Ralstonia sp. 5_2_56FAA]KFL22944.1 diguanylate cyclase domain protein [Ralstonia pickettii]MBU6524758.1 GGDEF domain-containing protein [Ralstonia sp. B265]NPT48307.1 diguanylate cyclase [Ralstonia sp. 3N]
MLDPGVAIATSALMSFVLLGLLGSLLRAGKAGIAEWFGANLAVVVALPLILLRGKIPDALSVVVANVLLALGGAAYYAGCARFLGRRPQWPILLAGVTAVGVAVIYWRYAVDSIPMRVFSTTLFSGAFCTALVWMLLRHSPAGRSTYPYRVTAIIAFVFGVCQLIRGVYFLTLHAASNPSMFATAGSVLLLVVAAAIMPILSMSAMLMVHDALLADARDAANRDFLTGALSRQGFEALARRHVGRVLRHARPLALLILDLDHFKRINDTLGHAAGDAVLRAFVQMAQAQLRPTDVLGRIGGEEFALLLPDTDSGNAMHLADRLRKAAAAHVVMAGAQSCRYSLSGGVAVWQPGESFDRLSARADRALYDAKHQGRDRICAADVVNVAAVA